jgi:hypothetical protein
MSTFPAASRRRFAPGISSVPALLATTSVAALLMATPVDAGQTIDDQTVANVTNPAGKATTSIVIENTSTVTGKGGTGIDVGESQVAGGITNAGTINAANGIVVIGGANVTSGVASTAPPRSSAESIGVSATAW